MSGSSKICQKNNSNCDYSIFRCKYCKEVWPKCLKIMVFKVTKLRIQQRSRNQRIQQRIRFKLILFQMYKDKETIRIFQENNHFKRAKMNGDDYANKEDKNVSTRYQKYMQAKQDQWQERTKPNRN
ncbi:UNKNOWN [Stylonychia lemnae]|uniref:Uncharacterized protein n=1 Tax=Stylonychia lemnae TaxID=5949 RepID=A0A078ABD6_STYLE|nr:UNKNOWN [Stylonychia lemnae]|eukprot:CDW79615.1 UNKNOWN [Stylonychia lemnae]